ncbi:MAG: hypothetical protein EPO40_06330 [Myxococcaceae bacterium]|nr:MAG: hypothetical protein EPO40_06330 [Myxococcaceae bacterium]
MYPRASTSPQEFAETVADLEFDIDRLPPVEALALIEELKSAATLAHSQFPTQILLASHGVLSAVRVRIAHRATQASRRMVVFGVGGAICAAVPGMLATLPGTARAALMLPPWLLPLLFCFGTATAILGILHKPDAEAWAGSVTKAAAELSGAIEKALDGRPEMHGPYRFPPPAHAHVAPPPPSRENIEAAEMEAERSADPRNRGTR